MVARFNSLAMFLITLLTLCGFGMSVFCTSAHACHEMTSGQYAGDHMVNKTDGSQDHKKIESSGHGNCCISHHCCSAKIVTPGGPEFVSFSESSVVQIVYIDQDIPSLNINNLDRPPKHLV